MTDDAALAGRVRLYRGQGVDPQRRYIHPVVGFNYRMTNIIAAIGLGQLERIDAILAARRQVAAWYAGHLAGMSGLRVPWLVTVLLTAGGARERDAIMAALRAGGIDSRPIFYPMHEQPPYREEARYPVAETLSARGLNLPTFEAMTEANVAAVCASLRRSVTEITASCRPCGHRSKRTGNRPRRVGWYSVAAEAWRSRLPPSCGTWTFTSGRRASA